MEGIGMRAFTTLVFLLTCTNSFSDTIQKWTDDSGQVHYGDRPPSTTPDKIERLEFENNFDPVAYEQAMRRNSNLEAEVRQIESREKVQAKVAEKRLDDYLNDLDRKARDLEREKADKRKSRESERNRSSIKLKRNKKTTEHIKTQPTFRRKYQR
jgi:hypothetical protein